MLIVLICGIGHILSSVILGLIGIWLGSQISFLVNIEDMRGEIAKWFLIAFGLIYTLWGIRKAIKNRPHRHILDNGGEVWHIHHEKAHNLEETTDVHAPKSEMPRSFWPLFVLLVLGPCEPLIPLLMYPAAETGMMVVVMVALVFSVCTIAAMIFGTIVVLKGVNMINVKKFERYAHALAGFSILMCGLAIQFLGI
jgi:sulfite exporter TauE/SafE